ncbi:MAG: N-acetylglucosamine-6-phosphate deacetylase [Clostridia bacterium]
MKTIIKNVIPFIKGKFSTKSDIIIENGVIAQIIPYSNANCNKSASDTLIIEGNGNYCASGFIDIHTHGGYGCDVMDATPAALDKIAQFHLDNGVTTFVPTTLTASIEDTVKALRNLANYHNPRLSHLLGAHLEGPFLSPKAAGAHPVHLLLNPNKTNTQFIVENAKNISRITVAPNIDGAEFLVELCVQNNIQVSLGHDNSIDLEIDKCVQAGATSVTHLTNCTSRPSRRTTPKKYLGLTEIGLIDQRLMAEVIADDRHVPNQYFGMIFKLKTENNICLVSDSLSVAGMAEGEYFLGSGESKSVIKVEDGVAVLPSENTYAGSITPISKMARNLFALGYSKEACLTMAINNPAKLLNLADRGDIAVGMLADFNILDENLNIINTILGGNICAK